MTEKIKRLTCGCPAKNSDYRIVNRFNHLLRARPGDRDAITVCATCGKEIEL